jgi:hypothetical protein
MADEILVIGYGPVGKATVVQLKGRTVRVAQRNAPNELPEGVGFHALRCVGGCIRSPSRARHVADRANNRVYL